MDSKFPEPRGWALKWEGTALLPAAECVPPDESTCEATASFTGSKLPWRQLPEAAMFPYTNGNGRNGLTRPQGWALQWDGDALAADATGDLPASLVTVERDQESAA